MCSWIVFLLKNKVFGTIFDNKTLLDLGETAVCPSFPKLEDYAKITSGRLV